MKINYKKNEDTILQCFMKDESNIKSSKIHNEYVHVYSEPAFSETLSIKIDEIGLIQTINSRVSFTDKDDKTYYVTRFTELLLRFNSILKNLTSFIKVKSSLAILDGSSLNYVNSTSTPNKISIEREKEVYAFENPHTYGIKYLSDTSKLSRNRKVLNNSCNTKIGYMTNEINIKSINSIDKNEYIYYLIEKINNIFVLLEFEESLNSKIMLLSELKILIENLNDEYDNLENKNVSQISKRVEGILTRKL